MPVTTYYVRRRDDPEATSLLSRLKLQGYTLAGLTIERVFRLESEVPLDKLKPLFVNPLYESGSPESQLDPADGPIIEVGYQMAVTDPETLSILDGGRALGVWELTWARLSKRYQFLKANQKTAERIVADHLYNQVVQMVIPPDYQWPTLRPTGQPATMLTIPLKGLTDSELVKLSEGQRWFAPLSQMKALQTQEEKQGRAFTDCEIEIILQSWCDHCFHTTWKGLGLFKKLHAATQSINHPLVVSVFQDNAGGMLFYEDWVITIKGETHNFPSSVATYGGIATKHGGVIRDTLGFGKGGYPIGGTTIMGTMDPRLASRAVPEGALHPATIVLEAIRGTADYCNPMGIPMMLPLYRIHSGYPKCFALGHSVGIIPRQYVKKDEPQVGDAVLLIGGRTGRDGIHGATISSSGMDGQTIKKDAAAVQIGHPILERNFMTAIPLLREAGCIRSITDLGAGGISCAVGEMASLTGVEIKLESVPLKDESLSPWEILLSESQERMLMAVPPEKLATAEDLLRRYHVEATVIGQFTATHRFVATHCFQKVVDLDMNFLWQGCPIEAIEVREPEKRLSPVTIKQPTTAVEWEAVASRVISHYHCCDQSPAGFQFDSTVQGRTVIGPYAGVDGTMPTNVFVSAPLRGKPYGVVFTAAFNPFYGEIDPAGLGRLMMVEAISKAVAVGVSSLEMVLCDNLYTPKVTPETAWDLKTLVESCIAFSRELSIPFVSGKDSSSGTFTTRSGGKIDVPNTFVCATLGRVPDVRQLVTKPFKKPGDQLILVGHVEAERLGGSVYLDCFGERGDQLPDWGGDLATELTALWQRLYSLRQFSVFQAASAIGEGGLFLRLFEMALGSGLGATVDLATVSPGRLDGNLFGEFIGTLLFEIDKNADPAELFTGLTWKSIGAVTPDPHLSFTRNSQPLFSLSLDELRRPWERTFREVVR